MHNRHIYVLSLALTLASIGIFFYKFEVLRFPLQPRAETQIWNVEASVTFEPGPAAVKVTMQIPGLTPGFTVLDENYISRGFGLTTRSTSSGREAQWAVRNVSGRQAVYYRALVLKDPAHLAEDTTPPFPEPPQLDEASHLALEGLIADVRRQSADIATFTSELLRRLNNPGGDQYLNVLLKRSGTPTELARLATVLLAGAQIPSRVAHGVLLKDQSGPVNPVPLLEVHDGLQWLYFEPITGAQGRPEDFLIWWRGDEPVVNVDGGTVDEITLAVQQSVLDAMLVAERRAEQMGSRSLEFSLFSLPIATQSVYAVLLMVPVGAFVIVLLRNFVGVKTFGTFMPVLVALAFRETRLFWGVMLFAMIVSLGLLVRFYLEKLRLLLVPRLTAVLTVVVMLMAGISVISHQLDITPGLSIALFPMVIIAMTIERMSIVWEERGASEAMQEGVGSLTVAALAYLVMGIAWLEHLLFVFPELLLLVLAATLISGRYTGYRLLELRRFRAFAGEKT